jgi:hypothetical protein
MRLQKFDNKHGSYQQKPRIQDFRQLCTRSLLKRQVLQGKRQEENSCDFSYP